MLALPLKSYAVDPDQLGLDTVKNFAVYANGSLSVNGAATTVNGDVGLGPNGTQTFASADAFIIHGTYQVDDTAVNSHAYSANISGGTVTQDINSVGTTLNSVSAYAAGLSPTLTFAGNLTTNYTFLGNGGYNVISLNKISYTGGQVLTLQGGADDVFIFNVNQQVSLSQATMVLNGVATNHILFNLRSTSAASYSLNVSGNGITVFGTFIAPSASIFVAASDQVYGGVFAGGTGLTLNSDTVTADVFLLPEPSSFALVGITCLFGLGVWSRRRHGASA